MRLIVRLYFHVFSHISVYVRTCVHAHACHHSGISTSMGLTGNTEEVWGGGQPAVSHTPSDLPPDFLKSIVCLLVFFVVFLFVSCLFGSWAKSNFTFLNDWNQPSWYTPAVPILCGAEAGGLQKFWGQNFLRLSKIRKGKNENDYFRVFYFIRVHSNYMEPRKAMSTHAAVLEHSHCPSSRVICGGPVHIAVATQKRTALPARGM